MKKILLSLLMATALVACGNKAQEQSNSGKPTIKIGGIFPLSGSQAYLGEAAKAGMLKALSEHNQDQLHYNYELVFEDNQGKLSTMSTIANKMILQDHINAIGTMISTYAQVMAPIADRHGAVQWAFSWEEKGYKRFGKYAFVQGTATQDMAAEIFNWVSKNKGNIAVFAQNAGTIAQVIDSLEKKLNTGNIKYIINKFNPGERDFRLTIAKAKENGFNKFIILSMPPEKEIVLKQLVEAQIAKEDILGLCLDMAKPNELYEGMKTVTYNFGTQQFIDNVMSEYNLSTVFGTAGAYDFTNLMVDAYEHLYKVDGKPTAEEVTAYIQNKKKYKCMSGACEVLDNGFIITRPKIRVCKDGKWRYIDQ